MINNNRQQIIALIDKAENKIQIAVSWLTDEQLISKLCEVSPYKKVELLLSCDPLNVWRFSSICELQRKGAKVLKTGSNAPGVKGFMHAKFMLVDSKIAYGGSFNFTDGANHNYENFKQYAAHEVPSLIGDFNAWWEGAKDYTIDFDKPEDVRKMVIENFESQEEFRKKMLLQYNHQQKIIADNLQSERDILISNEIEKEKSRNAVNAIRTLKATISSSGYIQTHTNGVASKPHRFFGGSLLTNFNGIKKSYSFSSAFMQKRDIETKFSFLKCIIKDDTLICSGKFCTIFNKYQVRIEFRTGCFPRVYVMHPDIKPNADIHIYNDGSLCLFYPGDMKWKDNTSIAEYTIPWIFEWLLYYELFLLTGVWEGEFVPHHKLNNIIDN